MNKVKGKIENWNAVYDNKNLDVHFHIEGEINGIPIHTSRVIKIEDNIATTKNSKYELGFPCNNIFGIKYNDFQIPSDEVCKEMINEYIKDGQIDESNK